MMLSVDPKLPNRRTYVVKVRSDATADALRGRVENLVTCKHDDFTSGRELVDVIARDIEIGAGAPPSTDKHTF